MAEIWSQLPPLIRSEPAFFGISALLAHRSRLYYVLVPRVKVFGSESCMRAYQPVWTVDLFGCRRVLKERCCR